MGGLGSTRWQLHTRKETVEECLKIDAARLIGKGRQISPSAIEQERRIVGSLFWTYTHSGNSAGSISFQMTYNPDHALYLMYRVNGEPTAQRVKLDALPCNYGGHRYLFRCPQCSRRARCLYKPSYSRRFACRKCHDLSYAARQEYTPYRFKHFDLLMKAEKLEKQLRACKRWRKKKARLWTRYVSLLDQVQLMRGAI